MFWIHAGAYSSGHAGPDLNGPEYFMDKNVIIVALNYRLGALGGLLYFMATKFMNTISFNKI